MKRIKKRFPDLSPDTIATLAMREMDKQEKRKENKAELQDLRRKVKQLESRKRKTSDSDHEGEKEGEPIHLKENYALDDNGTDKIDLRLRHRLVTPNGDPKSWWNKENGALLCRITRPVRGASLHLEHLMVGRVSNLTLMRMSDSGKVMKLKYLLSKNAAIEFDDDAKQLSIRRQDKNFSADVRPDWKKPETLWEVVDGVKNYVDAVHLIRGYSYEALVVDRALHHIRFFNRTAEASKTPEKLQVELCVEMVDKLLAHNAAEARSGRHPAVFGKALKVAKEILSARGLSDNNLMYGGCYTSYTSTAKKDNVPIAKEKVGGAPVANGANGGNGGSVSDNSPNRGGRGGFRGGRGGSRGTRGGRGGRGGQGGGLRDPTCYFYNSGEYCDSSCGFEHRCSKMLEQGRCLQYHPLYEHSAKYTE